MPSLAIMHEPLFHSRYILDPTTHLPSARPTWVRRALLRAGDLRALVSARVVSTRDVLPIEVWTGLPTMLAHCRPVSGPPFGLLHHRQSGWSQRTHTAWVAECKVGRPVGVTHVARASGALLPAPPATSTCEPHASLQPALVRDLVTRTPVAAPPGPGMRWAAGWSGR